MQIGTYPRNIRCQFSTPTAIKPIQGVVYLGTRSGIFCGAISTTDCNGSTSLLNRDLDPATNDHYLTFVNPSGMISEHYTRRRFPDPFVELQLTQK